MTREEILNMPAGREMDVLIAEKVMQLDHYEHRWEADGECEKCKCVTDFHSGRIYLNYKKIDYRDCTNPDPYSTDISAAWEVVDEIKDKWGMVNLEYSHDKELDPPDADKWSVYFDIDFDDSFMAFADTAPLAICRAALLAVV